VLNVAEEGPDGPAHLRATACRRLEVRVVEASGNLEESPFVDRAAAGPPCRADMPASRRLLDGLLHGCYTRQQAGRIQSAISRFTMGSP
jgi:hypothetical protein